MKDLHKINKVKLAIIRIILQDLLLISGGLGISICGCLCTATLQFSLFLFVNSHNDVKYQCAQLPYLQV